jgi:uncharacterized protein YjbI with pentapeptide repeats
MSQTPQRCPYIFEDDFERIECEHPVYKDHGYCVFHSENIEEKASDFYKAFAKWIVLCTQKLDVIDLRGFAVPEMKLEDIVFEKRVDFRSARFRENVLLLKVVFPHGVDLSNATFEAKLTIQETDCREQLRFQATQFDDDFSVVGQVFHCPVYFTEARFLSNAHFEDASFEQSVDFRKSFYSSKANFCNTHFGRGAEFSEAVFADEVDFSKAKLKQSTDYRGTNFKGDANFHETSFAEMVSFWMSTFSGNAIFREAHFAGNAVFWMCNFEGIADFRKAAFHQRGEFKGATFHNEIMLNQSRLQFLKELDATGVNMEGTILNSSHFWGVSRLEGYSFRDAMLLSNNFSDKAFIDCDFTGATFDVVHTRNWHVDEKTVNNTKHIFTHYTKETEIDDYGTRRDIFTPIDESRIPAKGDFNKGPNKGFTFADVFKHWHSKFLFFEVPPVIHSPMIHFLGQFEEYVNLFFQERISASASGEGINLRITINAEHVEQFETLDMLIGKYLAHAFGEALPELDAENNGIDKVIAAQQIRAAVHAFQEAASVILQKGTKEETKALLKGLKRLMHDWNIETVDEKELEDKLLNHSLDQLEVKSTIPDELREEPEAVIMLEPIEFNLDTFMEVKFMLDDLEDSLVKLLEDAPGLKVKISGIRREMSKVRDTNEDESTLGDLQRRIKLILKRTVSLTQSEDPEGVSGSEHKTQIQEYCDKIATLVQ